MIIGRIIKGVGGLYFVDTDEGVFECSVRGIFRKNKIVPTIGDFVEISVISQLKGTIEKILERKNILIRPKVSNIDSAILTFSITSPNLNLDLLNRFLIICEYQKIPNIIICINKSDLVDLSELDYIKDIYKNLYKTIFVSTFNNTGIDEIKSILDNKVSLLAGPSGVGKTSIVNKIYPNANLKTGEISKKVSRGKHTTRQIELVKLSQNTYIVDSPGFTSLTLDFIKNEDLDKCFKEFEPYVNYCKFSNCLHTKEPECAIKNQVGKNINKHRYECYLNFVSSYNN